MAFERIYKVTCDVPNCDTFFLGEDEENYMDVNQHVLADGWVFHRPESDDGNKICVCPEHASISRMELLVRLRNGRLKRATLKGTT